MAKHDVTTDVTLWDYSMNVKLCIECIITTVTYYTERYKVLWKMRYDGHLIHMLSSLHKTPYIITSHQIKKHVGLQILSEYSQMFIQLDNKILILWQNTVSLHYCIASSCLSEKLKQVFHQDMVHIFNSFVKLITVIIYAEFPLSRRLLTKGYYTLLLYRENDHTLLKCQVCLHCYRVCQTI